MENLSYMQTYYTNYVWFNQAVLLCFDVNGQQ